MKKSLFIASSALSLFLLSGCGNTDENITESTFSPTPTATLTVEQEKIVKEYSTEAKDPLVELLKVPENTSTEKNHLLNRKEFLEKWKETKGTLIDLRTPEEIKKLPMLDPLAKNFNVYTPDFAENFRNLDKNAAYFIYCAHGNRSASVYTSMKTAGFTNVFELQGGIDQ